MEKEPGGHGLQKTSGLKKRNAWRRRSEKSTKGCEKPSTQKKGTNNLKRSMTALEGERILLTQKRREGGTGKKSPHLPQRNSRKKA